MRDSFGRNWLSKNIRVRKNLRRFMNGVMAVGLTVALAACDGGGSYTLEEHMDRAREARIDGDLRRAILELKNALKDNPDASAARYLLGQIYIDMEDGAAAEKELMLARDLKVDEKAIVLPLAQAWILKQEYEKVLNEVPISVNLPASTQAALRVVHGDAYRGLGQLDEAADAYGIAVKLQPNNAEGLVGLGNVALGRNDMAKAKEYLDQAVKLDAANLKVITLQGDVASANRDFDTALKYYEQLVKARPSNVFYNTVLAWAQVQKGQYDNAQKTIQRVLAIAPNYPPANHIRALAAFQNKKYQDAAEYADRALAVDSNRANSLIIQGASNFALGRMEQAYSSVNRYVSMMPGDLEARKLLANILIALGRSEDAMQALAGTPGADGGKTDDAELLGLLAQAAMQKGDLESGRKYLEQSLEAAPDSAETIARLGMAQIASGNTEQGLQELKKSVVMDPKSFEKQVVYALELLRANKSDEAIAVTKEIQKLAPKLATGHTLEAIALAQKKNTPAAKAALATGLKIEPGNINASHNLVRYAVQEKNWAEAKRLLEDVLKHHKDNQKTLLMLADLAKTQNDPTNQMKYLERAVEAHPEAREPAFFLAQAYFDSGDYLKALNATQKVRPIFSSDPALLTLIGQSEMASGQGANAIVTFERLVQTNPDIPESNFLMAMALESQGNFDRARDSLQKTLELNDNHNRARLALARVLANIGKSAEAENVMAALIKRNPKDIDAVQLKETQAYIALSAQQYDRAVDAFTKVFAERPNSLNAQKLAEVQTLAGKTDQAIKTYNTWLQQYPDDLPTRFQLANLYLNTEKLDDAEREYGKILGKEKSNAYALNNYAWTFYQKKQYDKALTQIEKAVKAGPEVAAIHDTAGKIYVALKRPREAASAFRKAVDLAPTNAEVRQRYAESLITLDRKDEAKDVLNELLRGDYQLADRKGVERMLLKLSSE